MKYPPLKLWLKIIILSLSVALAFGHSTVDPVELQSTPQLTKVANQVQLTAQTIDYSNQLPIDGVVVQLSNDSKPEVFFKFQNEMGDWSDWQPAKLFEEPFTDRWMVTNIEDIAKESIQFEIKIISPAGSHSEMLQIGVFPTDTEVYPDKVLSKPTIFPTSISKPTIITRAEWGARYVSPNRYTNHPYFNKLTLHHTAGYGAKNLEEGKQTVKAIQTYHIDGRGWTDIGYHFLIDKAGNIYQGRPETVLGAHVGGHNTGNIGVSVMGCYHPPWTSYPCNEVLTEESGAAIVHLFAWLVEKYGYGNADVLKGHRDYSSASTACPGNNIHGLLSGLKTDINAYSALGVESGGLQLEFSINNNYPNPFNGTTKIGYTLPVESEVTIIIYNLQGQTVKELITGKQLEGEYSVGWDGKNQNGENVYSGIYYYQIRAQQNVTVELDEWFVETGKMVFLK